MKVKFYLRNPEKKGQTAIYASLCYHNKRVIVFPGQSIDTSKWVIKKNVNEPKRIPENNAIRRKLEEREKLYVEVYDKLESTFKGIIPPKKLKQAIYETTKQAKPDIEDTPVLIRDFFQTLIDHSKSGERLSPKKTRLQLDSIKPYLSAQNHFKEFETFKKKEYDMTDISQDLINAFTKYLNVTKKLSFNGSAKYLTVFKLLFTYAVDKKVIDGKVMSDIKFDIRREKSDNIYLTEKEIDEMMKITEFETDLYETVRDLFVIGCKTGLRFCDYSRLRLANINNGYIYVCQRKTLRDVTIPVHPIVKQILLKYPNGLPKCPPNQVFNRYLKEIGKKIPALNTEFVKKITKEYKVSKTTFKKWQLLQSHTARRSFCTNEYLNKTPLLTIMAISGHETQKSFMTYIKASSQEHATLLKKQWEDRK